MSGKDDFTFDDNDAFPETDLSSAFEESEQQAPEPPPKKSRKSAAKGSSRSRFLLMALLLIVAAGAGAYYFMGLGETAPEVVKAPPKAQKTVALPPKPAKAPSPEPDKAPAPSKPQQGGATVAVPPPPAAPTPAGQAVQPPKAGEALQVKVDDQKTAVAVAPPATAAASAPVEQPQPASPPPAKATEAPAPVAAAKSESAKVVAPPQGSAATGNYALDAGAYLLQSNRVDVEKKLRALGFAPQVTPVEAKVAMVRLRLGAFPAGEAQEALAYAKKITPSAFSLFKDGRYTVYAGTFFDQQNLEALRERFLLEGIKAEDEPVEVVRTLSRVRFGRFATSDEAAAAAARLAADGITATVVTLK